MSVGYQRRRALAGKWEASITSLVLLLAGSVLVLFVVYTLFTRILQGG